MADSTDRNCPICKGDGYVEVGDRPTFYGGLQASAVQCPCDGGEVDDLTPDQQEKWLSHQWGQARAVYVIALGKFEMAMRDETSAQARHCWARPSEIGDSELKRYETYRYKLSEAIYALGVADQKESEAYAEWRRPTLADDMREIENEHVSRDDEAIAAQRRANS